jgi:hypothetical protein
MNVNWGFGGKYRIHLQGRKSTEQETSVQQVAKQSKPLVETPVHIRITRRYIPEDVNIHNYRCENFKSYIALTAWVL